ncbi:MAG TPA: UxaA family hydrolase [Actinomycetes bacterium]|jgi:(2R)-sulfolactate sulfo-lyase subunit alpha|nr:UxaA family hydrolase [Actinomycetes bacterium]
MPVAFIIHETSDSVGVAVRDLETRVRAAGRFQHSDGQVEIDVIDAIPLGHKIAIVDIPEGDRVVEYGVPIGRATRAIRAGEHVHTHNLKGERWA